MSYNLETTTMGELLSGQPQYTVPNYQRSYVWQENNWADMWEDLKYSLSFPDYKHYTGIIALQQDTDSNFRIVDGQQRLMTCLIIICAIATVARTKNCQNGLVNSAELYLKPRGDSLGYRIIPKEGSDRDQFDALCKFALGGAETSYIIPESSGLHDAFKFFVDCANKECCEDLRKLLEKITEFELGKVVTDSSAGDDKAAYFFACVNNRGRQLTDFDQLRNVIFLNSGEKASDYYHGYWKHFDVDHWWAEGKQNTFLKLAVTLRSLALCGNAVMPRISTYLKGITPSNVETEIQEISEYSKCFRSVLEGPPQDGPWAVIRFLREGNVWSDEVDAAWLPVIVQLQRTECPECKENVLSLLEKYLVFVVSNGANAEAIAQTTDLMTKIQEINDSLANGNHDCNDFLSTFSYLISRRCPPEFPHYPPKERAVTGRVFRSPVSTADPVQKRLMLYVLFNADRHLNGLAREWPGEIEFGRHGGWGGLAEYPEADRIGTYSVCDAAGTPISTHVDIPGNSLARQNTVIERTSTLQNAFLELWPWPL